MLLHRYRFNVNGQLLLSSFALGAIFYGLGNILFISNIVQFGTDQLRDNPTKHSVYFIRAYFWTDSIGYLITSATYLPGREILIVIGADVIDIDKYRGIAIGVVVIMSFGMMCFLLGAVYSKKYSTLFLSDNRVYNPYKLVYNVLNYAVLHKKPVRPSAFTFCDNERPSRIDFGKQRYGGPFTTEQVEDVKVMWNVFVVLISISPIFLLEAAAAFSFKTHDMHYREVYVRVNDPYLLFIVDHAMVIPLSMVIFVPLFQFAGKLTPLKYTPNIFKKIGIAIVILVFLFMIYTLYDILAYDSSVDLGHFYTYCRHNSTYKLNKSFFSIPSDYVSIFQQIVFAVFQVLLYTSVYEFICCQSPQYMKGLQFGLFYALRAFNQSLGAATMYLFIRHWYSTSLSCGSAYYIFTLCIAVVSLLVYINVARKYKYRKRDDICNIYKFAEDYYSNVRK